MESYLLGRGSRGRERGWIVYLSLACAPPASWGSRSPGNGWCLSWPFCTWSLVCSDGRHLSLCCGLPLGPRLDWAGRGCKSPMEPGWWRWFMHLRHLPCNSERAVTRHFNEVANFLVTREVDRRGHHHLAYPRPLQGVGAKGNGATGPTSQTWERGGPGLPLGTPPPSHCASLCSPGSSPLWQLTPLSLNMLCGFSSPDLHSQCSCHPEHLSFPFNYPDSSFKA